MSHITRELLLETDKYKIEIVHNEIGDFMSLDNGFISKRTPNREWYHIKKGSVKSLTDNSVVIEEGDGGGSFYFYGHYHDYYKFVRETKYLWFFTHEEVMGVVDHKQKNRFLDVLKRYC